MTRAGSYKPLKLTVEWVPRTSSGKRLSKQLPPSEWKKIRERVYAEYGQQCAICGIRRGDRRLDCHEVWEYDDATRAQRLRRLVALCSLCHRVKQGLWLSRRKGEPEGASLALELKQERKHREDMAEKYRKELALSEDERDPKRLKGFERMANRESALEHFVEVNGCDLATGERHLLEALEEWRRRSKHKWHVDFGEEFAELLKSYEHRTR